MGTSPIISHFRPTHKMQFNGMEGVISSSLDILVASNDSSLRQLAASLANYQNSMKPFAEKHASFHKKISDNFDKLSSKLQDYCQVIHHKLEQVLTASYLPPPPPSTLVIIKLLSNFPSYQHSSRQRNWRNGVKWMLLWSWCKLLLANWRPLWAQLSWMQWRSKRMPSKT